MENRKTKLKPIKVGGTSESNDISPRKRYRVKVDDAWYEGIFLKKWFGWNFDNYGSSGIQLNLIDEVYEIVQDKGDFKKKAPKVEPKADEDALPEKETM
jgi:hypothetical protein